MEVEDGLAEVTANATGTKEGRTKTDVTRTRGNRMVGTSGVQIVICRSWICFGGWWGSWAVFEGGSRTMGRLQGDLLGI